MTAGLRSEAVLGVIGRVSDYPDLASTFQKTPADGEGSPSDGEGSVHGDPGVAGVHMATGEVLAVAVVAIFEQEESIFLFDGSFFGIK